MPASLSMFFTIVSHTPLWVWALYAMLLFLGFQRTRDSSIALFRMLILPAIVIALAISSFYNAGLNAWPWMGLALATGSIAGWVLEPESGSIRLPGSRIWLKGEWWTLGQIALVLIVRYAMNVVPYLDPELHANPTWHFGTLGLSTILSAIFLGRTAARLRNFSIAVKPKEGILKIS